MTGAEEFAGKLSELRAERAALETALTREDLARDVDEWVKVARRRAEGASRVALAGAATGDDLAAVLAEDALADDGLAGRIVKRLEALGFGAVSDRSRASSLKKLDMEIAKVSGELREAKRQAALEEVEREFAGEAA
jgi:hypothetical protein